MKRLLNILLVTAFTLTFVGVSFGEEEDKAEFKLIVHKDTDVDSLTKAKVASIFKKKTSKWEDDVAIKVFDQAVSSDVRKEFSMAIFGKKPSSIKNYWQRKIFSGRGVPPTIMDSDEKMLKQIEKTAGSIGYVSADADTSDVKVVEVEL